MAKYFNFFPKVLYTPNSQLESLDVLTNLTTRFTFEQKFKEDTSVYYKYDIRDGDTPEILSYKLYGTPEKHWIILLMNDIVDPLFDWPLKQQNVINFVNSKYSANASVGQTGYEWAASNIHSYYKIETQTMNSNGQQNISKYQIDANTYAALASSSTPYTLADGNQITIAISKEPKTYYEYEVDENENKRTIKILKPEIIPAVEKEFKRVLNDTIK
jgi:predicted secreted protein|tara:strand:+ start:1669 stop:2316 length:648 start_codon:yes stop_codon:yes gene_type:complete